MVYRITLITALLAYSTITINDALTYLAPTAGRAGLL